MDSVEKTCHLVGMSSAGNPPYREPGGLVPQDIVPGCSNCGIPWHILSLYRSIDEVNYCYHCGARIIKDEEEI